MLLAVDSSLPDTWTLRPILCLANVWPTLSARRNSAPTTAKMAQAATSFHLFPDLPTELRLAIWRECLPRRVVELDRPEPDSALRAWNDDQVLPICSMEHTTKANSVPPLISRVCHEARYVALEEGRPLTGPDETTMLSTSRSGQWFDPARDTIHRHCTDCFYTEFDTPPNNCDGNSLPRFLEVAREAAGASVQQALIECLAPRERRPQDHLETLRDYSVCGKVVCLHVDLQSALDSGLFAVDKRIVMVGAGDHARIAELRRLWEKHGSRQDFRTAYFFDTCIDDNYKFNRKWTASELPGVLDRRWVTARWRAEDKDVRFKHWESEPGPFVDKDKEHWGDSYPKDYRPDHPWVADVLSRKPNFHPTIMMRLCTQPCYAGLSEAPFLDFFDEWNSLCWRPGPGYSTSSV